MSDTDSDTDTNFSKLFVQTAVNEKEEDETMHAKQTVKQRRKQTI